MAPSARTEIEIDAPVQRVWAVMMDVAAYQEWNPFVFRVTGRRPVVVGSDLKLEVRWTGGRTRTCPERVTLVEPPAVRDGVVRASLAYRFDGWLHAAWMVRGSRLQELVSASGSSTTRYRTSETFRGLLARLVPLAEVQAGFERHAVALKRRAESLHP